MQEKSMSSGFVLQACQFNALGRLQSSIPFGVARVKPRSIPMNVVIMWTENIELVAQWHFCSKFLLELLQWEQIFLVFYTLTNSSEKFVNFSIQYKWLFQILKQMQSLKPTSKNPWSFNTAKNRWKVFHININRKLDFPTTLLWVYIFSQLEF